MRLGALLFSSMVVAAAPVTVVINGNFGPPTGGTTLLDNLDYTITYTVPDPHTPDSSFGNPDPAFGANALYNVSAILSIPALKFSIVNAIQADYRSQQPLGLWLNLTTFTGLPVGDFMVMTPLQTRNGQPLWNGLAGPLGNPELGVLTAAPASARFFVEQNIPGDGALPLAVYDNGSASISQTTSIPEPATSIPLLVSSLGLGTGILRRRAATRISSSF